MKDETKASLESWQRSGPERWVQIVDRAARTTSTVGTRPERAPDIEAEYTAPDAPLTVRLEWSMGTYRSAVTCGGSDVDAVAADAIAMADVAIAAVERQRAEGYAVLRTVENDVKAEADFRMATELAKSKKGKS